MTLACILGIASARENFDAARFARAIITLFLSQAHVGMTNDYLDRTLDAQAQPNKPIARGLVQPSEARALIIVAFIAMLAFALTLGPIGFILALLGTLAGQIYNFKLRGTPYSWVAYVMGFSVLPFFVWDAASSFSWTYLLMFPMGIPLVFAAHLAQTLPDVETDRALGVFGFAASLGRTRAALLLWFVLIAAHAIAFASGYWLSSNLQILFVAMLGSLALIVASAIIYYARRDTTSSKIVFRLVSPSALILVAGWLASLKN
ncbi:MAG: UbiA family prenyltransferase [Chloroflexi bacterium]|nr:UbiA family prenyltransferase [Chloroflexota bacterium]